MITAGIILAEAAILDGKEAIQSQSYGPEARGGSSKAEAIISDDKIYFGRVTCPDVLLAMSQEAANKYTKDCGKDSIVITDSLFVTEVPGTYKERIDLPITHTAIGVVALTHCVSEEALEKAVLNRVPKGTEEANKKALQAGKELITKR